MNIRKAAYSPECGVDCGSHGACVLETTACTNNGTYACKWDCQCQPGWEGNDCSNQLSRCNETITSSPDTATICYNGGTCESYSIAGQAPGTRCNCQVTVGQQAFAGHQCEYKAMTSCEQGLSLSNYAFCVNGGTCKKTIRPGQPHPLCDCVTGFSGHYCQFESDVPPTDEILYSQFSNDYGSPSLSGGIKWLVSVLIISSLVIFCVGSVYVVRRRRRLSTNSQMKNVVKVALDSADEINGSVDETAKNSIWGAKEQSDEDIDKVIT